MSSAQGSEGEREPGLTTVETDICTLHPGMFIVVGAAPQILIQAHKWLPASSLFPVTPNINWWSLAFLSGTEQLKPLVWVTGNFNYCGKKGWGKQSSRPFGRPCSVWREGHKRGSNSRWPVTSFNAQALSLAEVNSSWPTKSFRKLDLCDSEETKIIILPIA